MMKRLSFFAMPPDKARRREIENYLETKYPHIKRGVAGRSLLGEPLTFFRVGEGKPLALYVGAHHASEWLTALLLYRFLDECGKARRKGGASFAVLPLLNPDGVEIALHGYEAGGILQDRLLQMNGSSDFTHWQANARGVDLNHNYPAGFSAYKEKEKEANITGPSATRYSGEYPLSEPETSALVRLSALLSPALTLTLHTQGEVVFYRQMTPPLPRAAETAELLSSLSGYAVEKPEGLAAYGGLSDYFAEIGWLSYTLECGLGQTPLPLSDGERIYSKIKRMLFLAPLGIGEENA